MPDYKKKRKHYSPIRRKNRFVEDEDFPIKRGSKDKNGEVFERAITPPRLVKGKKQKRIAGFKVITVTFAVIAIIVFVLKLIFPVGIIEMAGHFFKTLGVGNYPVELAGNEIIDTVVEGDHYYVLTNTDVYLLTNNGKVISSFSHHLTDPVVKSSATRTLIFSQGKNDYDVYVNGEKKYSGTAESGLICGDVSDSGVYAVASYSKSYASTVSVYSSKGTSLYKWNCANDYINSVALSNNGKKIAVSTFNTSGGKAYSKIYIFDFKSSDSEKTITIEGEAVYELISCDKGFYITAGKSATFVDWKNKSQSVIKNEYDLKRFVTDSRLSAALFSRADNENDNRVSLIDNNGKNIKNISVSGKIKDISVKGKCVYVLGENSVTLYNEKGEKTGQIKCSDVCRRVVALDPSKFCLVTDNAISCEKIK